MKKQISLLGLALSSTLLVACGGGGSSDDATITTPPNVPNETISPELSEEFVPFEDQSILDKIHDKITGDRSNETDYNVALGHMVGEVFADYPYGRTGRLVQIYNLGLNSIKFPNRLCAEVITNGSVKTLSLKQDKENCIILDKTYRQGSSITQTVNDDTTTLKFTNVRYGSNVDFSLKDDYLISGSIPIGKQQLQQAKKRLIRLISWNFSGSARMLMHQLAEQTIMKPVKSTCKSETITTV